MIQTATSGRAFGMWVTSDVALPLCVRPRTGALHPLRIRQGRLGRRHPADIGLSQLGAAAEIDGEVSPGSGTVWLRRQPPEPGVCWGAILGLAMPHLAYVRGMHVLHASCVSRDGSAIAFLGHPRAGKSSVAAALVRRGWSLVSDDALPVVVADGSVAARPAFPAIRLFNPMAAWFADGARHRMVPIHPRLGKWWVLLDQAGEWHGDGQVALRGLCVLDRSPTGSGRLRGRAAFVAVLGASYVSPVEDSAERPGRDCEVVHQLAASIPVVRLAIPEELPPPLVLGDLVARQLAMLDLL